MPLIPQDRLSLVRVDSAETDPRYVAAQGPGAYAIDGRPDTFWLTEWVASQPPHPHEIVIGLNGTYEVSGFRYLPRQDVFASGSIPYYGNIKDFQFYVSADGADWGTPIVSGALAQIRDWQDATTATKKQGRYVRLVALSDVTGGPYTNAAEISVYGDLIEAPPPSPPPSGDGLWNFPFLNALRDWLSTFRQRRSRSP